MHVPLPSPPESSLPEVPDPESDRARAASPTVSCLLATAVTDPSFELHHALVAESPSASPPSVGGECALSTDVLEDRQEEFECLAAAVPRFASMLLAPEGDPDAPDIPTLRSYAEAIMGPYSSQWQAAMDAKMASWKSTCTYVDEVPPPGVNIVDGMWIFRVKRPPSSPPTFKARYVARGFRQRQGVVYFQTFSSTPKMTTLWAPREWHDTLRTTLAALGFAPSTADPSLFLHTDTSLPPFYVLVYVDDLVFATVDTEALTLVKSELQRGSSMGLVLGGRGPVVLTGHSDASWVDDSATQRSSQGYTFSLGSGSVTWRSTRSSLVLSSSCEAEIYARAMAAQELRWLTYLLTDLGEQPRSPPVLYVDNKAIIALCQEHKLEHRTKHIALRYFLARELQQPGQLRLAYVATRANNADIFTKALPPGDHQRFSTVALPHQTRCPALPCLSCHPAGRAPPSPARRAALLAPRRPALPVRRSAGRRVALPCPHADLQATALPYPACAPPCWPPHCLALPARHPVGRRTALPCPRATLPCPARVPPCWPPPCPALPARRPAGCHPALPVAPPCPSRASPHPAVRASLALARRPARRAVLACFDTWLDDLQLYLLSDSRDSVSSFDHTSGASLAPPNTADSATRSQWLTSDAAAHLAVRNHLLLAERSQFALYVAVVARYSSPATAAHGRLMLPYIFPELSAFATVEDLITHLRTSDTRYRAALKAEFLDKNPSLMYITVYFIVTRLPDSLRTSRDHFLALDPTYLTIDLLEKHLIAVETSMVAIGAARGTPRTPFFEGCSPSPLAPSHASAADILGTEEVGAASAPIGKRRIGKGKGGKSGGGGSRGGGHGGGGGIGGGRGGGGSGGGSGGFGGGGGGSGGSGGGGGGGSGSGGGGSGGGRGGPVQRGGSGGGQRQQQQRPSKTPTPQHLREWFSQRGASRGSVRCPYVILTGDRAGQTCWKFHTQHHCFSRLDDAWHAEFGDEAERLRWLELLRSGVDIFALDYDAILAAIESALPGTAPAEALHTFNLDSGASRCFFHDSTTLTPLPAPVPVRLADPSGGPVLARSTTVLPCPAVPSGSLSGLHLPSFSTNLVSTAALQDAMVTTTTTGGQRVAICTSSRTGRHLAMFTRRPGSSLYTLTTQPAHIAASGQVSALRQVAAPCSCRLLSHQALLWHHRLGNPSLPRLHGMHSHLLVSGLPRSLPPLLPSPAPPCLPCVKGRQRAAPHSSSFPLTTAFADSPHGLRLQLCKRFYEDLPILRLRSDKGGEFSFDLLRYFCRGEGILQLFTLPASPQQNGVAERRIGLVMDVACTSMIHAAAPHFLWPFAVWYDAHQLNLWPRVSLLETSPTLRWTGKVSNVAVFWVWGSRAFVCDTSADKLSCRAIPYVFLGFPPNALGWKFYHPTSRRVLPSQDVTFDESVPFYHLFPYRTAPLPPPPPLFLAPGPPLPSRSCSLRGGAARGATSGGAEPVSAEPGGADPASAEPGGAEPEGAELGGANNEGAEPGGAEFEGAESGDAEPRDTASSEGPTGASPQKSRRREPLSPRQLREWFSRRTRLMSGSAGAGGPAPGGTGAGGAGATIPGGARVTAGAGGTGGARAAGPGGARTRGIGAAGAGGVGGAGDGDPGAGGTGAGGAGAGGFGAGDPGAGDPGVGGAGVGGAGARGTRAGDPGARGTGAEDRGAGGAGAGGAGAGGAGAGGTGARGAGHGGAGAGAAGAGGARAGGTGVGGAGAGDPGAGGAGAGGAGAGGTGAGSIVQRRLFFVPPPPSSLPPPGLVLRQPDSPLPAPSPYAEQTDSLIEHREPQSRLASPASVVRTCRRVPRPRPPPNPSTHIMALRPSSVPLRVPMLSPPTSSLPDGLDPESDLVHAASPTVPRLLATVVTDPSFESAAASAIIAELVDFAAACRLDYATSTQWSLRRPVYGLRQAPYEWHDRLRTTLAALGFAPSNSNPSLFLRTDTSLPLFYILVYVNDLVFATADTEALTLVKSELQKRHTCTDLGELRSYLGLQITRDRARHIITLTQSHMVHQVLQRFGFRYSSPQSTPLPTSHSLSAPPSNESVEPSGPYPELVGCLMYLMTCTRPDLAYPLSILARYVAPGRHRPEYWKVAKRVLRYLCSTSGMGLVLGGRGPVVLTGPADASWVDDLATQWSSKAYTFSLGSGSVSWRSTRSSSDLSSSCEVELYAGAMAAQELRWLT
ncbi:unnamed protein product [Closterium sp. NIES-54]